MSHATCMQKALIIRFLLALTFSDVKIHLQPLEVKGQSSAYTIIQTAGTSKPYQYKSIYPLRNAMINVLRSNR